MINFIVIKNKKELDPVYLNSLFDDLKTIIKCEHFNVKTVSPKEGRIEIMLMNHVVYEVLFKIQTFDDVHLTVDINVFHPLSVYDEDLERLKLIVKNRLIRDWESCIWLEDKQSHELSLDLYRMINITENRLREFITISLNVKVGIDWWEQIVPFKIKQKYSARTARYKRDVPAFANVSDHLLSIDVDDLIEIITAKIKKWEPVYSRSIEDSIKTKNETKVLELLQSQLTTEFDFWKDCFIEYLGAGFQGEWEIFCKNRNHIAHNKLIDYLSFDKIRNNITNVDNLITEGKEKFLSERLSEEEKNEILEEIAREENLEQDIVFRKEQDACVSIWSYNKIHEKFIEIVDNVISEIEDRIYFKNGIGLGKNKLENDNSVLKISSKMSTAILGVNTKFSIDDSEGGTSELELLLSLNGNVVEKCQIIFQNAEVIYSSEKGYYMPLTEDCLDDSDVDDFTDQVVDIIDREFPIIEEPLLIQVDYATASRAGADGAFQIINVEDSNGLNLTKFIDQGAFYTSLDDVVFELGLDPKMTDYDEV